MAESGVRIVGNVKNLGIGGRFRALIASEMVVGMYEWGSGCDRLNMNV